MPYKAPTPRPDGEDRKIEAESRRNKATAKSKARPAVKTCSNGEADLYADIWPTNYTKGLPHNEYGIVDPGAFKLFFEAINAPDLDFDVPLGPLNLVKKKGMKEDPGAYRPADYTEGEGIKGRAGVPDFFTTVNGKKPVVRNWESPVTGHFYNLEGADSGAVGMAPVPKLASRELAFEIAEVYGMALLRDVPFGDISAGTGADNAVKDVLVALNGMEWIDKGVEQR